MKILTLEEQKKRLDNITYAYENVKKCVNRVRIHDYLPGQVTYNLGDYPAKFSIKPTEYDYNLIKKYAESGVGLIQVHEEWNDSQRVNGATKFTSHDKQGMDEFIDLCHQFGIKIIPYISTGFFDVRDKDFTEKFSEYGNNLTQLHYNYRMCSLKSPYWSEYLFKNVSNILEEHDFDGLYNDMGHDECCHQGRLAMLYDEPLVGEKIPYEPCCEDMLVRLYSMVKSKGKIMKLHYNMNDRPIVKDKVYDYLWVGEAVSDMNSLKKTVLYDQYIVPSPDFQYTKDDGYEAFYAQFLPRLQFPLRVDGRPLDPQKRISVPGITYFECGNLNHYRKMAEFAKAHPEGPHMYGEWSNIPDNEYYRERWFYYLKFYKEITKEDNVCYIDIKESTITKNTPSDDVCMSLFVGDEAYICISNMAKEDEKVLFNSKWQDMETDEILTEITLKPQRVRFLKKMDD